MGLGDLLYENEEASPSLGLGDAVFGEDTNIQPGTRPPSAAQPGRQAVQNTAIDDDLLDLATNPSRALELMTGLGNAPVTPEPRTIGRTIREVAKAVPYGAVQGIRAITAPFTPLLEGGVSGREIFPVSKTLEESARYWQPNVGKMPDVTIEPDASGMPRLVKTESDIGEIFGNTVAGIASVAGPIRIALSAGKLVSEIPAIIKAARPVYRNIMAGMIAGGLTGEGEVDQTLENAALFAMFEGLPHLKDIPQAVRESNIYRRATIKERGLMLQNLDEVIRNNPDMTQGEILRRWPNLQKEARTARNVGEGAQAQPEGLGDIIFKEPGEMRGALPEPVDPFRTRDPNMGTVAGENQPFSLDMAQRLQPGPLALPPGQGFELNPPPRPPIEGPPYEPNVIEQTGPFYPPVRFPEGRPLPPGPPPPELGLPGGIPGPPPPAVPIQAGEAPTTSPVVPPEDIYQNWLKSEPRSPAENRKAIQETSDAVLDKFIKEKKVIEEKAEAKQPWEMTKDNLPKGIKYQKNVPAYAKEHIAWSNSDGTIMVTDAFFDHSAKDQMDIIDHEKAHFVEGKIAPGYKARLFDNKEVMAYRGKNINEKLANMIQDGKLPASVLADYPELKPKTGPAKIPSMSLKKGPGEIPPQETPLPVGGNPFKESLIQGTLYHGSGSKFQKINKSFLGKNTNADSAKMGFFLTDSHDVAREYSEYAQGETSLLSYGLLNETFKKKEDLSNKLSLELKKYHDNFIKNNGGNEDKIFDNKKLYAKYSDGYEKINKEFSEKVGEFNNNFLEKFPEEARAKSNPTIYEAYINIKNPLKINAQGKMAYEVFEEPFLIEDAIRDGHDSIILENVIDNPGEKPIPSDVYLVFNKKNVLLLPNRSTLPGEGREVVSKPAKVTPIKRREEIKSKEAGGKILPTRAQPFPALQIAGGVQPGERGPTRTPAFPKGPLEGENVPGSRAFLRGEKKEKPGKIVSPEFGGPEVPTDDTTYLHAGLSPKEALKVLREHLPITKEHEVLLERIYSNPWYMAKAHPEAKPVVDVQLRRDENRNQYYVNVLRRAEPFFKLKGNDLKNLEKKIIEWDAQGIDLSGNPEGLKKSGLNPVQIEAYKAARKVLDQVNADFRTTLVDAQLVKYRSEPFYQELKKFAHEGEMPKDDKILNDPGFVDAMMKLTKPLSKINELRNEMGKVKGYFPRVREPGNYGVSAKDADGNMISYEQAKTIAGAKALVEKHQKAGLTATYREVTKTPESVFQGIDAISLDRFLSQAIDKIKAGGGETAALADELQNEVLNAMVETLKARGWTKHGIQRTTTGVIKGYKETDLQGVLNQYLAGYAGWKTKYIASYEFAEELGKLHKAAPQVFDYFSKYAKDALRNAETVDQIAAKARGMAFTYYLMGNMKQVFLQASQGLTTVLPQARKIKTFPEKDLLKAQIDVVIKSNMSQEEARMFQVALDKGIIDDPYVKETTARIEGGLNPVMKKAAQVLSLPISGMEKFNRAYTMLAAYRWFREKGQGTAEAFKSARDFVLDVHWLYGKANLPEVARGEGAITRSLGRAAYTFIPWQHNYLLSLKQNWQSGGAKGKIASIESLAWMALLAGPLAIPFLDDLMDIAEKLFMRPLRKEAVDYLNDETGAMSPFFTNGMAGLMGTDISGSMKIGIPGYDLLSRKDADIGENLFGVFTNIGRGIGRGAKLMSDKEFARAIEEMSPTFLKNPQTAIREYTQGRSTWKGKPIFDLSGEEPKQDKITLREAATKAAGFNPQRRGESNIKYQSYANMNKMAQGKMENLADRWVKYHLNDDEAGKDRIIEDLHKFNEEMEEKGMPEFKIGNQFKSEIRQRLQPSKRQIRFNRKED